MSDLRLDGIDRGRSRRALAGLLGVGLTDILRIFYLRTTKYTFFSGAPGTFSMTHHMLAYKTILNKS